LGVIVKGGLKINTGCSMSDILEMTGFFNNWNVKSRVKSDTKHSTPGI